VPFGPGDFADAEYCNGLVRGVSHAAGLFAKSFFVNAKSHSDAINVALLLHGHPS